MEQAKSKTIQEEIMDEDNTNSDTEYSCEFCLAKFKSEKLLQKHSTAKYCATYRYVTFTCQKCNFSTLGIKNIERHMQICKGETTITSQSDNSTIELRKRISQLEEQNLELQVQLARTVQFVQDQAELEALLRLERFKNQIYRHIIEKNTRIHLDDIIEEKRDGLHIYNPSGNSIPIFVYERAKPDNTSVITSHAYNQALQTLQPSSDTTDDSKKPKKTIYRKVKSSTPLASEMTEEDKSIHVNTIDAEIQEKLDRLEPIDNIETVYMSMTQLLLTLEQSTMHTKILEQLKRLRWSLFGRISLIDYQILLEHHIETVTIVLRNKNFTEKRILSTVEKGLLPLESRITWYGNYFNRHLDVDELERLELVLDLSTDSSPGYTPYNPIELCQKFYNYGVVLFPLVHNMRKYMFNRYGFSNIVFAPFEKNAENDPYSFYMLEKIENDRDGQIRHWGMDHRLEHLAIRLASDIYPYMISIYRKMYRDIFGDNEFRPNYTPKCQVTECDLEQLLQNILLISHPRKFCNCLRRLVKTESTLNITDKDKFNMRGDDTLQRRKFQRDDEDVDPIDTVRQLFDTITTEEAVDFYRTRC